MTNGCFDIFHLGHLQMLNYASSLGDQLFVALNSDQSIKKLKGESRPIFDQEYRLTFISSLPFVTEARIFESIRCVDLILEWSPDIYLKSSDYNLNNLDQLEKQALMDINCKIEFMDIRTHISTSSIIKRIKSDTLI